MYKLGIVGFGVVGKSVLMFLNGKKSDYQVPFDQQLFDEKVDGDCFKVNVWDKRSLTQQEVEIIKVYGGVLVDGTSIDLRDFIKENDFIIPSPGIDLTAYQEYNDKFLCELDFFDTFFKKPVVAVTGSFGKTTVTKLIGKLASELAMVDQKPDLAKQLSAAVYLEHKKQLRTVCGGNVGTGMLDVIGQQDDYDVGVIELSSFQLELNKKFTPDIAVWTNLYPNHLDRHRDLEQYFQAKFNLIRYQHEHQAVIFSDEVFTGPSGHLVNGLLTDIKAMVCISSNKAIDVDFICSINRETFYLFSVVDHWITVSKVHNQAVTLISKLVDTRLLPPVTFTQNWIQVIAALYLLGNDVAAFPAWLENNADQQLLDDLHHRVEHVGTVRGVDFYNDSKSTVIQTTQAAVEKLALLGRPLIVIVGGLGKGVDRSPLDAYLASAPQIKKRYCFGKDCGSFASCAITPTLEAVMNDVASIMQPGDIVLFSPSGSSFDLFKNYEHRGQVFKELVGQLGARAEERAVSTHLEG